MKAAYLSVGNAHRVVAAEYRKRAARRRGLRRAYNAWQARKHKRAASRYDAMANDADFVNI